MAGQLSGASPAVPSGPQSSTSEAEKGKIKEANTCHLTLLHAVFQTPGDLSACNLLSLQEYERRLAKLQADYNAEQQSKAKLQEDIAALRSSYESKLSDLEKARTSRGSAVLKRSNFNEEQCKNSFNHWHNY